MLHQMLNDAFLSDVDNLKRLKTLINSYWIKLFPVVNPFQKFNVGVEINCLLLLIKINNRTRTRALQETVQGFSWVDFLYVWLRFAIECPRAEWSSLYNCHGSIGATVFAHESGSQRLNGRVGLTMRLFAWMIEFISVVIEDWKSR